MVRALAGDSTITRGLAMRRQVEGTAAPLSTPPTDARGRPAGTALSGARSMPPRPRSGWPRTGRARRRTDARFVGLYDISPLRRRASSWADASAPAAAPTWSAAASSSTGSTTAAMAKVKRITVDPGQRLSYQLHHRRAEHWFVVARPGIGHPRRRRARVLGRGEAIDIAARRPAPRRATPGRRRTWCSIEVQPGRLLRRGRHRPPRGRLRPRRLSRLRPGSCGDRGRRSAPRACSPRSSRPDRGTVRRMDFALSPTRHRAAREAARLHGRARLPGRGRLRPSRWRRRATRTSTRRSSRS